MEIEEELNEKVDKISKLEATITDNQQDLTLQKQANFELKNTITLLEESLKTSK